MHSHLHFSLAFLVNLTALLAFGFAMVKNPSEFFASGSLAFISEVLLITTVGSLFEQKDK